MIRNFATWANTLIFFSSTSTLLSQGIIKQSDLYFKPGGTFGHQSAVAVGRGDDFKNQLSIRLHLLRESER